VLAVSGYVALGFCTVVLPLASALLVFARLPNRGRV